jgi:hypothetical protein
MLDLGVLLKEISIIQTKKRMPSTVVFLGAGATKACNGPLTSEILPNILKTKNVPVPAAAPDPAGRLDPLEEFLTKQFHVTAASPDAHYPSLPLLMSLKIPLSTAARLFTLTGSIRE